MMAVARSRMVAITILLSIVACGVTAIAADPLDAWRHGVSIRPVSDDAGRHTIHAYFNACPESPDGSRVLFYASSTADGHVGEIRVRERTSGRERVLAQKVTVEDAHRAACQQWISGGRKVAFHNLADGAWRVVVVDLETSAERVLARGWQLGWGQANGNIVPLYGPHWNPGEHRDLGLLDVGSGEIRAAVTADLVRTTYRDWITKRFGDRPVSIFFPVLSPDQKRVFFKMATPAGGDFRSSKASLRLGLVCYDLAEGRFRFMSESWGHPSWHPDSRTIVEKGRSLVDSGDGTVRRIPGLPGFRGDHPTTSPDGRLFATDTTLEKFGGTKQEWGVVVCDMRGDNYVILHRFDNSQGARSWRRSHPHPAWSADGRRLYYNVSQTAWTQLYVAETAPGAR